MSRLIAVLILLVGLSTGSGAVAQDRVALLVVNAKYDKQQAPVDTAGVAAFGASLKAAGFDVTVKQDVGKDLRKDLESFALDCPNGGVLLFYFAGFGNRYPQKVSRTVTTDDGEKKKVTTVEPNAGVWSVDSRSPDSIFDIAKTLRDRSRASLNLVVFDCAAPSPFAKGDQQGLPAVKATDFPTGLICYAMPPEQTLAKGESSLLASSLAKHIGAKNVNLETVMTRVGDDVAKRSGGKQTVWFDFPLEADRSARIVTSRLRKVSTSPVPPSNPQPGDEWINALGMVFCWCPPGSFRMGISDPASPQAEDAKPVDVSIREGFWISKYELTNGDYYKMRRRSPSRESLVHDANVPMTFLKGPSATSIGPKTLMGVEQKAGRLPDGWVYRLPTEAEWEYACRAGTSTAYSFGDSPADLHRYANYADESLFQDDDAFYYSDRQHRDGVGKRPAPVGRYEPNAWGIHDMHGNVVEYVADQYTPTLPGGTDPRARGQDKNSTIVHRGGAWCSLPEYCQAGFRTFGPMSNNDRGAPFLGMRLVLAQKRSDPTDKKN